MARVQDVSKSCFNSIYDFIDDNFDAQSDMLQQLHVQVHKVEKKVMLELIKRDAVEQVLSERVLLYASECDGLNTDLTGAL